MQYTEIVLKVSFNTPAFLGNSLQQGQWRTPPFKALLRQWWRVVKAKTVNYEFAKLLTLESELFGSAADKEAISSRSLLRIRLNNWQAGQEQNVSQAKTFRHPEVQQRPVPVNLYMGYGPVSNKQGETKRAIAAETETAELWLGFPAKYAQEIKETIQLISWFGTIGSRSRNAWGSLNIIPIQGIELKPLTKQNLEQYTRSLEKCIEKDWAHAIGCDKQSPLIWKTSTKATWEEVMADLANIKVKFRTNFICHGGKIHNATQERHIIAYPITNHSLQGLGDSSRLANSMRFKIIKEQNQYRGLIFHLPCCATNDFLAKLNSNNKSTFKNYEKSVWQEVHKIIEQSASRLG